MCLLCNVNHDNYKMFMAGENHGHSNGLVVINKFWKKIAIEFLGFRSDEEIVPIQYGCPALYNSSQTA